MSIYSTGAFLYQYFVAKKHRWICYFLPMSSFKLILTMLFLSAWVSGHL